MFPVRLKDVLHLQCLTGKQSASWTNNIQLSFKMKEEDSKTTSESAEAAVGVFYKESYF